VKKVVEQALFDTFLGDTPLNGSKNKIAADHKKERYPYGAELLYIGEGSCLCKPQKNIEVVQDHGTDRRSA
jgi:hypothetical protein